MPTRSSYSQSQTRFLVPAFGQLLTRAVVQEVLHEQGVVRYWRVLTPLVVLWGMLYQRLLGGATLDAVVSAIQDGDADGLDPADPHAEPPSQRLRSVSTSAYNQARQRLPVGVVQALGTRLRTLVLARVAEEEQTWRGHRVRWLDGTTFRLPPEGDLEATYGRAAGSRGVSHWVIAKSVVSFCWASWLVVAHAESAHAPSEVALVRPVIEHEPDGTVYVADRGFGIYRTAQVADHFHQHVLLRLDPRSVPALLSRPRGTPVAGLLAPGTSRFCCWQPRPGLACEPGFPLVGVPGRLLMTRLERAGFRPKELYLFTTLVDEQAYPCDALVALYGSRWQVELRYRDLKTTLGMDAFAVRSAAAFRTELEVGLLAYSLIRVAMLDAAVDVTASHALAFARCRRRVATSWVLPAARGRYRGCHRERVRQFRERLARCRPCAQPHKVAQEPRALRRTPQTFPALKGSRQAARDKNLAALGAISS